jgi:hypothetical protein
VSGAVGGALQGTINGAYQMVKYQKGTWQTVGDQAAQGALWGGVFGGVLGGLGQGYAAWKGGGDFWTGAKPNIPALPPSIEVEIEPLSGKCLDCEVPMNDLNYGDKPTSLNQFSQSTIDESVEQAMKQSKLQHIFEQSKHGFDPMVNQLGSRENTIRAVLNAANNRLPGTPGVFGNPRSSPFIIDVSGFKVGIQGTILPNHLIRISTMYIPQF